MLRNSDIPGKELSRDHVSGSPLLGDKLSDLHDNWENIEQNWDDRAKLLNQCRLVESWGFWGCTPQSLLGRIIGSVLMVCLENVDECTV